LALVVLVLQVLQVELVELVVGLAEATLGLTQSIHLAVAAVVGKAQMLLVLLAVQVAVAQVYQTATKQAVLVTQVLIHQ